MGLKKTKGKTLRKKNKTFRKNSPEQIGGVAPKTAEKMSEYYYLLPRELKKYTQNYTKEQLEKNAQIKFTRTTLEMGNSSRGTLLETFMFNIKAAILEKDTDKLKKIVSMYYANDVLNTTFDYRDGDDVIGLTPLLLASKLDFTEGVKILIAQPGISVNKLSSIGITAGEFMVNMSGLYNTDYKTYSTREQSALHFAVKNNNEELVKILCSIVGLNVNVASIYDRDNSRRTPLDLANLNFEGANATAIFYKLPMTLELKTAITIQETLIESGALTAAVVKPSFMSRVINSFNTKNRDKKDESRDKRNEFLKSIARSHPPQ
jgi:nitrogen regulatory protein PII-like uncharacterized protein